MTIALYTWKVPLRCVCLPCSRTHRGHYVPLVWYSLGGKREREKKAKSSFSPEMAYSEEFKIATAKGCLICKSLGIYRNVESFAMKTLYISPLKNKELMRAIKWTLSWPIIDSIFNTFNTNNLIFIFCSERSLPCNLCIILFCIFYEVSG